MKKFLLGTTFGSVLFGLTCLGDFALPIVLELSHDVGVYLSVICGVLSLIFMLSALDEALTTHPAKEQ